MDAAVKEEEMKKPYIEEKITNINELEALIKSISACNNRLEYELRKDSTSIEFMKELSVEMKIELIKAENFKFNIERRLVNYCE